MPRVLLFLGITASLFAPFTYAQAASVRLPATFHRQEHSLSCEVAALKTAMGTLGIPVSETELIAKLPFDTTPRGGGIWGDPNEGFVGDINGRMLRTGYGVYAKPIANVGKHYARTEILRDPSPVALARSVAAGKPVIMWGYYRGAGAPYSWQTPAGKTIAAVDGEHTSVVYGFDGDVKAPTHFSVMDPITGAGTWSTADLMANWKSLNYMAVTVAPRWVKVADSPKIWEISADGKTRSWITTLAAFKARGGKAEYVVTIGRKDLDKYIVGPDIS